MIHSLPAGYNSGDTIYCYFPAYNSSGASVTITGLAVTDIEIYKNGSTTQRSSDNGYTLLDTDGIDFDSITGIHGFSLDTSDNSDSGFWADGSHYLIVVNAITVDSQTVVFAYELRLGMVLRPTTAGRTLTIESDGQAHADVKEIEGSDATNQITASVPTAAAISDAVWDEAAIDHGNAGSFGLTVTTMAASITSFDSNGVFVAVDGIIPQSFSSTVDAEARGWFGMAAADLDTQLDAIVADTNELQTDWVNGGRLDLIVDAILDDTDLIDDGTSGLAKIATDVAAVLVDTGTTLDGELAKVPKSDGSVTWNATALASIEAECEDALQLTVPDTVPADGSRPNVQQAVRMILQILSEHAISGTTWTIKKEDGSTTLLTLTLDDATNPTSATRAT